MPGAISEAHARNNEFEENMKVKTVCMPAWVKATKQKLVAAAGKQTGCFER